MPFSGPSWGVHGRSWGMTGCSTSGPFVGLSRSRFQKAVAGACRHLGVQFRVHDLRHACASRLVAGGVALAVVQRWLGHRDITSTMRYVHVRDNQLQEAARALFGS